MKRLTVTLIGVAVAAALASCQQQAASTKPKAVLLVHWAQGGADFSREYASQAECALAAATVLRDYASRSYSSARASIVSKADQPVEPRPTVLCIPA